MTILDVRHNDRLRNITVAELQEIIDCLQQWQNAAWAGDAYEYCNASNERDRILDELLGEGNAPSRSEQPTTNNNPTIGDN